jgi:hypothetical protein
VRITVDAALTLRPALSRAMDWSWIFMSSSHKFRRLARSRALRSNLTAIMLTLILSTIGPLLLYGMSLFVAAFLPTLVAVTALFIFA